MEKEAFFKLISGAKNDHDFLSIIRKHILHGLPYVFNNREDNYYEFRSQIANQFNINFHEVFIVGSAKLGFSCHKKTNFSLESDIDVVLVNQNLFEEYQLNICNYQYDIDKGLVRLTNKEKSQYQKFLTYMIRGWMRPDLLPQALQNYTIKQDWFDYFRSISYKEDLIGNYKVNCGLYKNYSYLEKYHSESLKKIIDTPYA